MLKIDSEAGGKNLNGIVLKKLLSNSEKRRHYVTIPGPYKEFFPASAKIKVCIKNKVQKVDIDKYSRIHLGSGAFHSFKFSDGGKRIIIIKKGMNEVYSVLSE